MHPRIRTLIAALLCGAASCRHSEPTPPLGPPIVLEAYTDVPGTGVDSIYCSIYAVLPLRDTLPRAWSGTATVRVLRWKYGAPPGANSDTVMMNVPFEIASHSADSLRVTIGAPTPLVFDGRFLGPGVREATGRWTCGDQMPLARVVPGTATGLWWLSPMLSID